jgi:nucleotide-binding universal stress UspA family protein
MAIFRKILCPVDFSDKSIAALDQAAALARQHDGLLYLMHVEFVAMNSPEELAHYANVSIEPNRCRLERIAEEHLANVRHQLLLRSGWPAGVIVAAARELEVDLIVIATEGWFSTIHPLGDTAEHVVRASSCPVLSFGSFGVATSIAMPKRILCPIDFDPNSIAALNFARRIAEEYRAAIVVLHVVPVTSKPSESGPESATSEPEQGARTRLVKVAEENLGPDARCELVVRRGDPVQTILEVENEPRADLIVMATHGRTGLGYLFLGSVAVRIVRESIVPVLTVREQP